jgi:hypothetical protein
VAMRQIFDFIKLGTPRMENQLPRLAKSNVEVRGLSKAALWLQLKSFAFIPCAPRPTGRTSSDPPEKSFEFSLRRNLWR